VGKSTAKIGSLKENDYIVDVVGPLGKAANIEKVGTVVTIGGGVGCAITYPETKAYKEAGNYVISIMGFRNVSYKILEDEMKKSVMNFTSQRMMVLMERKDLYQIS